MTRTTQAIVIHETGDPDVLKWETVPLPDPAPGEVQMRHKAIGLNFLEVNFRAGVYTADLPYVPGGEGAGTVTALGEGVETLKVGDRVAYAGPRGSYAVERNIAADRLVALPDGVPFDTAAAMLFKGLTARYLLRQTFAVGPGHRVLYHAAAGGLGLIFCQWAASLGATVIGTVGSDEKAALARAHGCAHVINYRTEDFVARIRDLTGGAGVDVVYDSVGKDTFPGSLDCLRPRGLWVLFGRASGSPPPLDMALLGQKGSLYATRPTLANHIATRAQLVETADDLFAAYAAGAFRVDPPRSFPLSEARLAHAALETRTTTGATILLPD
jgi:NADPH:quinone reductase